MISVNCLICGKVILTYPSWIKSGKSKYCSRSCSMPVTNAKLAENGRSSRFTIGQVAHNKNGFTFTKSRKNGKLYKLIYIPTHPQASKKGYIREHRLVMENKIGRYLTNNEIVHHRDGDTLNNDVANLEILSVQEHSRLHVKDNVHKRWYNSPLVNAN